MMKYVPWMVAVGLVLVVGLVAMRGNESAGPSEGTATGPRPVASDTTTDTPASATQSAARPPLTGTELAANYYVFTRADFDALVQADVPIHLFFYANWCPTCAAQDPIHTALFTELGADNPVVGLRVNFNDNDTDDDEKALAREFGVRYQHTLITLDAAGTETSRLIGQTTRDALLEAFSGVE